MERSKIALHKWMMGFYLMNASKKGVSAHQLHRALDITYQSAWFMCHRIREAMRDGGFAPMEPMHKVRFLICDKGGRNRKNDLRNYITSIELDAEL